MHACASRCPHDQGECMEGPHFFMQCMHACMCARLPAVGQVQVREGGQRGEAAQALIGQLPAVAGLQVLQRAQRRAVPQRLVAQLLVALHGVIT